MGLEPGKLYCVVGGEGDPVFWGFPSYLVGNYHDRMMEYTTKPVWRNSLLVFLCKVQNGTQGKWLDKEGLVWYTAYDFMCRLFDQGQIVNATPEAG